MSGGSYHRFGNDFNKWAIAIHQSESVARPIEGGDDNFYLVSSKRRFLEISVDWHCYTPSSREIAVTSLTIDT